MFLASAVSLVAAVATLAAAPDPATEVKPVHVDFDAPTGCATANDFFTSLRSRTDLVRQATKGEPRTTLQVRLLETRRYVLGELRIVDDGGQSDTRRVQGANCGDVVQALALAAAVALDPRVLLPATVTIPAPSATAASSPPSPAVAPAKMESTTMRKPVESPSSSAFGFRIPPRYQLGAGAVGSVLLSSSISPGVMIIGRWTPASAGRFRPTLGLAVTYLRNDIFGSPGAAQASLTGLVVTLCGPAWGVSMIAVQPCGLVMAGLLSVRGHQVVNPSSVDLLWLSAGAVVRTAANLGHGFALELEAGASLPILGRELYTTLPSHVVEKTPTISPMGSLGVAYGF